MPRRRSITIASTGAAGTWAAAVSGIERALVVLAPQTHVVVSSAPKSLEYIATDARMQRRPP
jgi:hypothetical protein